MMLSFVKKTIVMSLVLLGFMIPNHGIADPSQGTNATIQHFEEVSKKMFAQWEILYPELKSKISFQLKFVSSPINNAQAKFSDGRCDIIFYTSIWNEKDGLIQKNSDDEFAAILGHEMGHCFADHQGFLKKSISQMSLDPHSESSPESKVKTLEELMLLKRGFENAADAFGIQLMEKAGFNAWAAVDIWERAIAHKNETSYDRSLDTHPPAIERAERVRRLLESKVTKYLRNR